jgi:lipopolysaccharide export system permease protein
MQNGQQLRFNDQGHPEILSFKAFTMLLPVTGPAKLLRSRGGDERELTLFELARQARSGHSTIPQETLKAELYGRLARAFALPLLPLLGVPLGLAAKRSGRAPGMVAGGVLLLAFYHGVKLGEGLATSGRAVAELSVGIPYFTFAAIAVIVFVTSRKRPGETPIARVMEYISNLVSRIRKPSELPA